MISREEASESVYKLEEAYHISEGRTDESIEKLLDKIYNSIGLCGECKYRVADRADTTLCINEDSVCFHNIHENNWYCADFERKED